MPTIAINPGLCPLCGQTNRCAVELEHRTGLPQPACWCMAQDIAPESLARLPPDAVNRACLCPRCAAG